VISPERRASDLQLYLIRHRKAGSRENYDVLPELGKQQARLPGEHFREAGSGFCGSMRRQRDTAELVLVGMKTLAPHLYVVTGRSSWRSRNNSRGG
jgi:broad specificity phosphatase PhoE